MRCVFVAFCRAKPGEPWREICRVAGNGRQDTWRGCVDMAGWYVAEYAKQGLFRLDQISVCVLEYPDEPYAFDFAKRRRKKKGQ